MAGRDAEPAGLSGQLWMEGHRVMPRPALVAWLLGKRGEKGGACLGEKKVKRRGSLYRCLIEMLVDPNASSHHEGA